MENRIHRRARRMAKVLLAGLITVTSVTGVASTASAATFSVKQAQWNLAGLGYLGYSQVDGLAGPNTSSALRSFQKNRCISADGKLGPDTTAHLSALMKAVQKKVGSPQDGMNGPNTKSKIQAWQKRNGLNADGQAGKNTLAKMGITYAKDCPPPPPPPPGDRCAKGTDDLGTHTTYVSGRAKTQRLCAIPGFRSSSEESNPRSSYFIKGANGNVIVNAKSSGKVLDMYKAARRAGVPMSARSSFRTMKHQQELCKADAGCRAGRYGKVARPGYSNHQSGTAIDINMNSDPYKYGATCRSGRSRGRSDKTWNWLYGNAHKYGFRQYAAEAWHWEYTSSSSTRC